MNDTVEYKDNNRSFKISNPVKKFETPWMEVLEYDIETDNKASKYYTVTRQDVAIVIIEVTPNASSTPSATSEIANEPKSNSKTESKFLLIHQFRYGVKQLSWEVPMGGIDKNETPLEGAIREAREETGLNITPKLICSFKPNVGLIEQDGYIFHTKITEEELKNANFPKNEDEIIGYDLFTRTQIMQMIDDQKLIDMYSMVALFYYFLHQ